MGTALRGTALQLAALQLTAPQRTALRRAALLLLPLVGASACLEPAHDRALRDELVGRAESEGTLVSVEGGLAAVRELDEDHVLLWQSAPGIDFEVERPAAGELALVVHNTMPGAVLEQRDGVPTRITEAPREHPTRAEFGVAFESPGRARFRLRTPADGVREPFRIALMSDVQEAIDRVSDLYRRINDEPDVEFLLGAGDLTQRGTRRELERFERELLTLQVPYYTTLGNHELGVTPPPYQEMYGRASFSFEYRGARFTLLDSASATIDSFVLTRLDEWLEQGRDQFHVVAMHIPPIDPVGVRQGSFASRNEANALLARLLGGGVDLTLYGHLHSYFRFENGGIAARVSGGGGAIPERFDRIGRHFLSIDIDPSTERFESRLVQIEGD